LIASLSTASAEEKKEIMARSRKLSEMIKLLPTAAPSSNSNASNVAAAKKPADRMSNIKRERLDKELELHGAEKQQAESIEDLKAKLERLKVEAMGLGLDSASASTPLKASTTPSGSATLSPLAKQQFLEKAIAEHKTLIASHPTASAEEKKEIMERSRKLSEEMTELTSSTPSAGAGAVSSSSSNAPIGTVAKRRIRP
jgi:hypothetical protein